MVMPSGSAFWAGNLTTAVTNGSVAQDRLDDMATSYFSGIVSVSCRKITVSDEVTGSWPPGTS
jgi:hypothetical protein